MRTFCGIIDDPVLGDGGKQRSVSIAFKMRLCTVD